MRQRGMPGKADKPIANMKNNQETLTNQHFSGTLPLTITALTKGQNRNFTD
jgi:hypothetical protein